MSIDPRRQDTSGKRSGSHPKKIPPEEERRTEAVAQPSPLLAFTLEATTGKIVKLEGLDSSGAHHELTAQQMADLSKEATHGTLTEALERVFEAGIASVLGSDQRRSQRGDDSAEDAELRQLLLSLLFEHSAAKRLVQPDALRQTILKSLLHDALTLQGTAEGSSTEGQLSDRAAPSRAN